VWTTEEIEAALAPGYEGRGFEVKGPGEPDGHLLAKVARAALSLGNLRDGGVIVVGIDDEAAAEMRPGLNNEEHTSWLDYDTVSARINAYADPPLRFDVASFTLQSDARIVVVEVHEFADTPHLCAKDYHGVLRKGALYVRTRKLPETAEIPTSAEMRELLDLAMEKRLRAYVEAAGRAGVRLSVEHDAKPDEDDNLRFDQQMRESWDE
jgi:hypothetical protein